MIKLSEITNWSQTGPSLVEVTFVDGSYPTESSNFAAAFKFKNTNDLTKFSFKLLHRKQQMKSFDDTEQKAPQLDFRIDLIQ